MIDQRFVGWQLPAVPVDVERGRLRFFADVIGETDPVYRDVAAARAAGHPDLPVPPTFFFTLNLESPNLFDEMGVDLRHVLHGEQQFTYHRMAHAGESFTLHSRVADIYHKAGKGGMLEFIATDTSVHDGAGGPVADLRSVTVVQHREAKP